MPEMVQVGNETNPEILGGKIPGQPINWDRNARLLNAGIQAVQEAGRAGSIAPRIMKAFFPDQPIWTMLAAAIVMTIAALAMLRVAPDEGTAASA